MEHGLFEDQVEVEASTPQQGPLSMHQHIATALSNMQQQFEIEMRRMSERLSQMELAAAPSSSSRGHVFSSSFVDANTAKLLDLKPPSWSGRGDIERSFILPWRDYLKYTGIGDSAPGVVAKIMSSCPPYLQEALRAKRTYMESQGEEFPTSAAGLFALMLKTRPPMDKMRLSLTRMTTNKVMGQKLMEYNQQFLSSLNDIASLTVEQLQSFLYVCGLTGEVRKEVEAKMDWKIESYSSLMDYATQVHSRLRGTHVLKEAIGPSPMELGAVGVEQRQNVKRDISKVQCHYCQQLGHFKAHCPQRKAK
jgi:hypothetical protein